MLRRTPRPAAVLERLAHERPGAREAKARILRERALDGGDEPQRQLGDHLGERGRILVGDPVPHGLEVLAAEGRLAREQLVRERTERELVGGRRFSASYTTLMPPWPIVRTMR
jgi:hypothetical protein